MTTDIRDRRFLPALVAVVVAAFLVIPMVTSAPMVRAQSQEQEDPCEGVPRSTFEDRNAADEVHRQSIDCVDFYDISSGDASGRYFRPNRLVTRGQMATFIINTLEAAGLGDRLPNGDPPDEFSDIATDTHRTNINRLARIGVVQGSNGQYRPEELVRRDQMATFLLQAKEWAYQEDYVMSQSHFGDVSASNVHYNNVNAAYDEGLVRGTSEPDATPDSGTYAPSRSVRRQNMASFLSNELQQVDAAPEQFCAEESPQPTSSPTSSPTPTASPTNGGGGGPLDPILDPSEEPSDDPSASPSPTSTASPSSTASPTTSPSPTASPCATREASPSPSPTGTASPTASPSPTGSASPTSSPSPTATATPTEDCLIVEPICP